MGPRTRVLLVEDEPSYVDALTVGLDREGFDVVVATDGAMALDSFEASRPDLILLDVMLPEISGIDVCRRIRSRSKVPIIMVSAKTEEIDTVVGLEVGADDYVAKPYRLRELVARMRAVLRRVESSASGERSRDAASGDPADADIDADIVAVGDVRVDLDRHEVHVRGEQVRLPLKEFELLTLLMENAGRVLQRATLIDQVWGNDYVGDTKTLDVHIKRVRSKVEVDPTAPQRIVTIRGLGYKFEDPNR